MTEKVVGYLLLTVGLATIIFSALDLIFVFTGRADPVTLFHFSGINLNLSSLIAGQLPAGAAVNYKPAAPAELIPADMINQVGNMTVHLFLMGFLVSVGYKIASLGVQLLRPIVVKAKDG